MDIEKFFKNSKFVLKIFLGTIVFSLYFVLDIKDVGKYDKLLDYGIISENYDSQNANEGSVSKKEETVKINEISDNNTKIEETISPTETKEDKKNAVENQQEQIQNSVNNTSENSKDDIDKKIISANQMMILNMHSVGDDFYRNDFYDEVCKYYGSICNFLDFGGTYSVQQKNNYLVSSVYIINKLNKFVGNDKLVNTIYSIKIFDGGSDRRGYAGHSSININTYDIASNREFFEVLTHELGHIIDLGVVNGSSYQNKSSIFTEFGESVFAADDMSLKFYALSWLDEKTRKKGSTYKDFVSGYSMTDPFEDFAESFNMYINHNYLFQAMAKTNYILEQKYEYIKAIIGDNYLMSGKDQVYRINQDPTRRERDSTKMN